MNRTLRILLVEDDDRDVELIRATLEQAGHSLRIRRVETETELQAGLAAGPWDIVLADYKLPWYDGIAALRLVRQIDPHLPVVLVSGAIGEEAAVAAMREGADDYVFKDNLRRLGPVVEREVADAELRRRYRDVEDALLEASPEAMVVVGPDGLVLRANRRAEEMFGFRPAALAGRPFVALVPSLGTWTAANPVAIREELSAVRTGDLLGRREDGFEFPIDVTLTPLVSDRGVAVIAAIRDASRQRRRLDELARRADALARENGTLRAQLGMLEGAESFGGPAHPEV